MKNYVRRALAIAAAISMLAGCGASDASTDGQESTLDAAVEVTTTSAGSDTGADVAVAAAGENEEPHGDSDSYDYDESDVVEISLGTTISATSDDIVIDGTTATITAAGSYEVTGSLTDGQLVVDAGEDAVVQIILNNADITNTDGAAIAVMNAETAIIILADGSSNTLTDGEQYVFAEGEDEPNATLFSKADLTIGGAGSLMVVANYNDGIASKDGLVIDSGTITVDAVDDGIRGKDYVVINGGEIDVVAGGDGIKSDNDEDAERGYIDIADGVIVVASGDDAIQAATDVLISAGTLKIAAADDAIKGELFVTIDGGSILITESFEGIEAEVITINDGHIDITSNDDGLNVASADATTTTIAEPEGDALAQPEPVDGPTGRPPRPAGGPAGGPGGDAGVGEHYLYINGGTTVITITDELAEQGDGIDANGHIKMTGGLVVVSGPTDTRNSAIDYSGGTFEMSGGIFIGTNINGRNSEGIGAGSTQASLYVTLGSVEEAGTLVHIQSGSGESLVTFEPGNEFDVVVFSSADLVTGETYEIYLGGTAGGDSTTGLYETYTPGTSAGTATAS